MRRTARHGGSVLLAGAAALAPLVALTTAALPASAAAGELFAPPPGPMILTRTLRRSLPDGKEVLTRRSYEIRFIREDSGFRVDGALVDVAVEAPASLKAIADLERGRPDTGLFPMWLDARGRIVSDNAPQSGEVVARAVGVASAHISASSLAPEEKERAQGFVRQLQASPARNPWPEDLFHPAPGLRTETRRIPGAEGTSGSVRIDIEAHSVGSAGLLDSFARSVTTDLGSDSRVMHELWTLRAP